MKKNQIGDLNALLKIQSNRSGIDQIQPADSDEDFIANTGKIILQKNNSSAQQHGSSGLQPIIEQVGSSENAATLGNGQQMIKATKKIKGILQVTGKQQQTKQQQQELQKNEGETRKDRFGALISKERLQRIQFNSELEEVIEVENWKQYNVEEKRGICPFSCRMFQTRCLPISAF